MSEIPHAYVRNLRRQKKDDLRLRFESLLFRSLGTLGFDVVEQSWAPDDPLPWARNRGDTEPAGSKILYEHLSRNQTGDGDLFYMEMYLNGTFTVDREGWGPFQESLREMPDLRRIDPAVAGEYCLELSRSWLTTGESKYAQPSPKAIEAPQGYILVPLQLSQDDAILLHADIGVVDFLDQVAAWACDRGQAIVIKTHPYDEDSATLDAVRFWVGRPNVYCINENIHSLISQSSGVITITSGCGFESLVHGKPVVTFGKCDYDFVTFPGAQKNLDDALLYIRSYTPEQRAWAQAWIYYYLKEHVIDVRGDDWMSAECRLTSRLEQILMPIPSA